MGAGWLDNYKHDQVTL